jgi:SHS2 domain-containing protein
MPKQAGKGSGKSAPKREPVEAKRRARAPVMPRERLQDVEPEELYDEIDGADGGMPSDDSDPDRVSPEDIYRDEAGEGVGGEGLVRKRSRKTAISEAEAESMKRIQALLEKHMDEEPPRKKGRQAGEKKFDLVEHTADVGVQAYGETVSQAFENAALGMFSIITDPARVAPNQDFQVIVEGENLKELLQDWLSQLLILSQVQGMLFSGFKVELKNEDGKFRLTGQAIGEPVDPDRHVYKTEIKAVTHHMLEVHDNPPKVKVLFDL